MRRFILIVMSTLATYTVLSAQNTESNKSKVGKFAIVAETCYEHLFLDANDGLKSSWGIGAPYIGVDYYMLNNIYLGASAGASYDRIGYDWGEYGRSSSNIYDMRLPLRVGLAFMDRKFKLDTGPFVNLTIAGETTYYNGSKQFTTKIRDMDVSTVSLGWSISIKLFEVIKLGYSFILTGSPYGEGGDVGFLSIGVSYSIL